MQKIKLSDEVIIVAGKDKGKKGKVLKIDNKNDRILVEGINMVKKSFKPTQEKPDGGYTEFEKSVHASNVAIVSPKTGGATRVRIEDKNGKKVRVAVKCGSEL